MSDVCVKHADVSSEHAYMHAVSHRPAMHDRAIYTHTFVVCPPLLRNLTSVYPGGGTNLHFRVTPPYTPVRTKPKRLG